jgi:protease-4
MLKWMIRRMPLERVAVVPFSGPIFKRNIDEYLGLFRVLEENRRIKGVMLEMESPGGSSTASECLFHRLKRLNEKKPLYCYALMAASGGYMAAAAARKIYASSTALVGSIGVLSVKPVLREFMEKVGVNLEVMKKGAMKDMTLFHRESTEEERRSWEALHEEIYARFIDLVAGARALEREKVAALASGELFSARRALDLGLIDGVMDYDAAMEELYGETGVKPGKAVTVRPRKPFFKRIVSQSATAVADELWWRAL